MKYCFKETDCGIGVFCSLGQIKTGELIDAGYTHMVSDDVNSLKEDFWPYTWKIGGQLYVVFSDMTFVNHSDKPNAEVSWKHDDLGRFYASLRAVRPISDGEEITIRYENWHEYIEGGYA